jgi:hypothetical protein
MQNHISQKNTKIQIIGVAEKLLVMPLVKGIRSYNTEIHREDTAYHRECLIKFIFFIESQIISKFDTSKQLFQRTLLSQWRPLREADFFYHFIKIPFIFWLDSFLCRDNPNVYQLRKTQEQFPLFFHKSNPGVC